jgi:hypothetical protein
MGFSRWAIFKVPDTEPEEFEIAIQDSNATQGKPFMKTTGSMSEEEVRKQLERWYISASDMDAAFQRARQHSTAF